MNLRNHREPPITRLPPELLAQTFKILSAAEKLSCRAVGHRWGILIKTMWPGLDLAVWKEHRRQAKELEEPNFGTWNKNKRQLKGVEMVPISRLEDLVTQTCGRCVTCGDWYSLLLTDLRRFPQHKVFDYTNLRECVSEMCGTYLDKCDECEKHVCSECIIQGPDNYGRFCPLCRIECYICTKELYQKTESSLYTPSPPAPCSVCETHYCDNCDLVAKCDKCKNHYCTSCGPVYICGGCKTNCCEYCDQIFMCDECETYYCEACEPSHTCG